MDARGRPRANVLVYALRDPQGPAEANGIWCADDGFGGDTITDREGRFSLLFDPAADTRLVAGEPGDPLGMVGLFFPPLCGGEITLHLPGN